MEEDKYLTIKQTGTSLIREKGSRFIGIALSVEDEAGVRDKLKEVAAAHTAARHICYAYRLGQDGKLMRQSDAGEPSGTAGKPILNQVLARNLTNVLLIVVRYFGGVLLGTGGLIQAYREAASGALDEAGASERFVTSEYCFEVPYARQAIFMDKIHQWNAVLTSESYGQDVARLTVKARKSDLQNLQQWLLMADE